MPAGFSALDFYYILPELLLTGGAMVVLLLAVVTFGVAERQLSRGWSGPQLITPACWPR